ncbi:uncharacterized protein KRP23_15149 [Phytophthora ramorum]|uniref:uncharacterized protein n=1 Tax=Phytophthora ramorum TaxID=164328 RepID=UPI0030AD7D1D|nr:hypothetical protein KRP23_15149 [Phytophthora ramorum]
MSETAKPSGSKRVRRVHRELPLYRQQVDELQLKVKRLKLQKTSPNVQHNWTDQIRTTSSSTCSSVWNDIAEGQLKERLRAEQQNEELKMSYSQLIEFSDGLQKFFQRCENSKQELCEKIKNKPQSQYWDLITKADDEIFSEQLTMVVRMYLELQQRWKQSQSPSRRISFGWDLSLGEEVIKFDPNVKVGIVFEARSGTVLPFKLDVAVEAFWKLFGCMQQDVSCISHSDISTDSLVRSFSLKMDFEGFFSRASGKYTCRKFVTETEVMLVWIECADLLEFGGAQFHGMQYLKRGYVKLRRVLRQGPGEQSTSTVVEAFSETSPVFQEGTDNQAAQTQDLIKAVKRSYSRVNNVFCQTMSNFLLEEDWKATVGGDRVD